ncbi:MAG: hypothetical protein ACE5E2_01605 [Candidatus Binatia bacterium]
MMESRDRDRDREGQERSLSQNSVLGVLCCVVLFVGYSCGKKGDPRAPELAQVETIKDLKGRVGKAGIVLTWSRPTHYVDGKRLQDLAGFVIFRKDITSACPECPVPFRERVTILVEDQQKFIKKRKFSFVDQEMTPQTIYHYRVFSRLLDGSLSTPSNEVGMAWRP